MRRAAILVMLLLLPTTSATAQYFFRDLSATDMTLLFRGEGFGLTLKSARLGRFSDADRELEVQHWVGAGGRLSLYGERHAEESRETFDDDLEHLTHLYFLADRDVPVEFGTERHSVNALGHVRSRRFAVHDGQCLAWTVRFAAKTPQDGETRLLGFYCQASPVSRALAEALVSATGYRDRYEPVAPAPGQFHRTRASAGKGPASPPPPMPVQIRWEGRDAPIAGTMFLSSTGETGRFRAQGSSFYCKGRLRAQGGPVPTPDNPLGTWHFACSNGAAASGTFEGISNEGGTGWGADSEGNLVWIEYGAG